jgi:HEAT repeat protein
VAALISALGNTHFLTCRLAAWALGQIGSAAVAPLSDALRAPDIHTRTDAAWALTQMGPEARAAAAALTAVLRPAAARVAARTGKAREEEANLEPTVPIFLAPRRGTEEAFLIWTVRALGAIGREAGNATAQLQHLLRARNGTVRLAAQQALQQIEGTRCEVNGRTIDCSDLNVLSETTLESRL